MTDHEKLLAYAKEVKDMIGLQKQYFRASAMNRKGQEAEHVVRDLLEKSKKQEHRVQQLTDRIFDQQSTLGF